MTETTPHTCIAVDEQDHTPQHLRTLSCPRCAELREHYANR